MNLSSERICKYIFLGLLTLAFGLTDAGCLVYGSSTGGGIALTAAGALAGAAAAFVYFRKCERPLKFNTTGFALAAALHSFTVSEVCIGAFIFKSFLPYTLMGYALYAVIFLVGAAAFKKPKIWFCAAEVLLAVYSVAQYYLILFRESPVKFVDLANLRSAAEIKSEYSLTLTLTVAVMILQAAAMLALTVRAQLVCENNRHRLIAFGSAAAVAAAVAVTMRPAYEHGKDSGIIRVNFSGSEEVANEQKYGNLLMFISDSIFNRPSEPEGYSAEKAKELINSTPAPEKTDKKPVIIAVLNESWADYSTIAPLSTNKDYLPVWHSLTENTVKGYVTVSPYGGYTCNSEYELLTGNTMQFLPLGSAPFSNYMSGSEDSIVTYLNSLGFDTVAYTPCRRVLWDIGGAYEKLGFKRAFFGEETGIDMDNTINGQPSDSELFKGVMKLVDGSDRSNGMFVWVTTMQNHASYSVPVEGGVELSEPSDEAAERYLNCVYQSDKALGELIDHYKDSEDEVIILMFGDHFPHIKGFAETLYGRDNIAGLPAEDYACMHRTPYVIWSNRDIAEREDSSLSLNYMGTELMRAAGLPLSQVQQELEHIRESLPVISSFGYMTADGKWYSSGEKPSGSFADALDEYRILQYYRTFDDSREVPGS